MTHTQKSRNLISALQERFPATRSIDLEFQSCTIRTYCNSPVLLAKLAAHYDDFVTSASRPDILLTLLETPPFIVDSQFDLVLPVNPPFSIDSELVDELEGRLSYDPASGMIALLNSDRFLLIGPCLDHTDTAIGFIYDLYHRWHRSNCQASKSYYSALLPEQ